MNISAFVRRFLFLFIGSVSLIGLLCAFAPDALAAPLDTPSPLPHAICRGSTIPQGWVIVDVVSDWSQCNGSLINQFNVEVIAPPPTVATSVCSISPLPADWVIVSEGTDLAHCGSLPLDVETIVPAAGMSMDICTRSHIPAGWVISAEYTALNRPTAAGLCPVSFVQTSFVQETIVPVTGAAMQVCHDSPVPQGYMVQTTIWVIACGKDQGNSLFIVPNPTNHN